MISVKNEKYIWAFVALVGLYVGLYWGLPADPEALEQYQLSQNGYRLLSLTVLIPLLAVYFATLYGFLRFREYAEWVRDTKEGKGFALLANGLMVLAFSLPITTITSALLNYIAMDNPDLLPSATITKNYLALFFPFVTFLLLARGAEALSHTIPGKRTIRHNNGFFIIVISCIFTWLITSRPAENGSDVAYFLPDWLIISTLAIPYLYMWVRGIMATFHLRLYTKSVKGKVYKEALNHLAFGITSIVFLSIIVQVVTTLSARLTRLSLTPVLLIVYLLVALYAVGYGYVARGAKKLKKIEEV